MTEEVWPDTLETVAARERGKIAERLAAASHAPPATKEKRRGLPSWILQEMAIRELAERPNQPTFSCFECSRVFPLSFVSRQKAGVGTDRMPPTKTVDFCPECGSGYRRHKFEYGRGHLL